MTTPTSPTTVSDVRPPTTPTSVGPADPVEVITRFNAAFNAHDVDAVMELMTPDCRFEGTAPPDGIVLVGRQDVRRVWQQFFASSPGAHFEAEEVVGLGDRVVVRWRYTWVNPDSSLGHVRGIDLFRVVDGRVAEKLAYVKG